MNSKLFEVDQSNIIDGKRTRSASVGSLNEAARSDGAREAGHQESVGARKAGQQQTVSSVNESLSLPQQNLSVESGTALLTQTSELPLEDAADPVRVSPDSKASGSGGRSSPGRGASSELSRSSESSRPATRSLENTTESIALSSGLGGEGAARHQLGGDSGPLGLGVSRTHVLPPAKPDRGPLFGSFGRDGTSSSVFQARGAASNRFNSQVFFRDCLGQLGGTPPVEQILSAKMIAEDIIDSRGNSPGDKIMLTLAEDLVWRVCGEVDKIPIESLFSEDIRNGVVANAQEALLQWQELLASTGESILMARKNFSNLPPRSTSSGPKVASEIGRKSRSMFSFPTPRPSFSVSLNSPDGKNISPTAKFPGGKSLSEDSDSASDPEEETVPAHKKVDFSLPGGIKAVSAPKVPAEVEDGKSAAPQSLGLLGDMLRNKEFTPLNKLVKVLTAEDRDRPQGLQRFKDWCLGWRAGLTPRGRWTSIQESCPRARGRGERLRCRSTGHPRRRGCWFPGRGWLVVRWRFSWR